MSPGKCIDQPSRTGHTIVKAYLRWDLLNAWGGAALPSWKQLRSQGFAYFLDVVLRCKEVNSLQSDRNVDLRADHVCFIRCTLTKQRRDGMEWNGHTKQRRDGTGWNGNGV
jgi:hypothetical protein